MHDELVVVASDGEDALSLVRSRRGGLGVVVLNEEVEDGERAGMGGLGEQVACEHEDIIGLVIG